MIDATLEMQLFNMSAENGLVNLPDNSIDLVVTSPPYGNLRTYGGYNQYDFPFITRELYRVMKPGGAVVWVEGDQTVDGSETLDSFRHAIGFKDLGFNIETMIYQKNGIQYPNHNGYDNNFEFMFIISKGKMKTFNPIRDKKNLNFDKKSTTTERRPDGNINISNAVKTGRRVPLYGKRTNVWQYSTGYYNSYQEEFVKAHPAVFPEKLAEDHIISWSNPGDLVMDIFLGSGTTAKMAKIHGRRFIGFEVNPEYFKIAEKRIDFPVNKKLF